MSQHQEIICRCGRRFMGQVGDDELCEICTDRAVEVLDLKPMRKERARRDAMTLFIEAIPGRMTEMIKQSGNVEFVNTTAAMLRQEAVDLLE